LIRLTSLSSRPLTAAVDIVLQIPAMEYNSLNF
jgi:hypothetical protein